MPPAPMPRRRTSSRVSGSTQSPRADRGTNWENQTALDLDGFLLFFFSCGEFYVWCLRLSHFCSTPDAVFGSEQYEYQSAVESLQAVESDYARRKAALDQKREAEGGAKKKTAKATTTSGNTDDSAPQQDVSESSSEGEFAYDRESGTALTEIDSFLIFIWRMAIL